MSDIPRARELLEAVLRNYQLPAGSEVTISKALKLMTREPAIRRARGVETKITPAIRKRVKELNAGGVPQADIAHQVGLRNAGRVSEILNGKR
jgi:hypothetical protein